MLTLSSNAIRGTPEGSGKPLEGARLRSQLAGVNRRESGLLHSQSSTITIGYKIDGTRSTGLPHSEQQGRREPEQEQEAAHVGQRGQKHRRGNRRVNSHAVQRGGNEGAH